MVLRLFKPARVHITSATYTELRKAVEAGCSFLDPAFAAAEAGSELSITALTSKEIVDAKHLPSSLGSGEAESIAVCLNRPGAQLLTNDKRARNYCRERKVGCFDLAVLLRALWVKNVATKKQVSDLIDAMERKEGLVIKNKQEILG